MTVEEMQNRLHALSNYYKCRLDQEPNMAGMMYVEFGYLEGPTIEEGARGNYPNAESRYMTCLHELGHFHHGHTQGRPWNEFYESKAHGISLDEHINGSEYWIERSYYFLNGVLRSEAQAWNYALDKCRIPSEKIAPETRAFMWEKCLNSYFSNARAVGFDTPGQKLYNGDRAYVPFAYGKPDAYFFQTKRRILEGDNGDDVPNEIPRRISNSNWTFANTSCTMDSTATTIITNTGT